MPTPKRSTEENGRFEAALARHNRLFDEISKDAYIERVTGDFMEPFLKNGDHVLVDPNNDCLSDGICCFEFEPGYPKIARVTCIPAGCMIDGEVVSQNTIRIHGDNKRYQHSDVPVEKARLALMGRVRIAMKNV
jgi:phage repressor protein C with HTH and peptisase S24 domain